MRESHRVWRDAAGLARQQALAMLSRRALEMDDRQALLDETVADAARSLGSTYVAVFELLPEGTEMCLCAGVGWKSGLLGQISVDAGDHSLAAHVLRSDAPLVANELQAEARFKIPPLLLEHGVTRGMAVKIHGLGRPFGVLGAFAVGRHPYSADEAEFLQTVANMLAAAIARNQASDTHRRLRRERDGPPGEPSPMAQEAAEHRHADEKLKRSELLLSEAQQIAHIGSWNWDLQSAAFEWSDEHYRIFGLKVRDPPITLERAWGGIHSDDRHRVQQIVARSVESRQPYECSFRVLLDDGSVRTAHSRGQVAVDETGEPVRLSGTIQDITERREAEEKLKRSESLLAEAQRVAHLGNWSHNLRIGELVWSDEMYRIFGLRPQEVTMTFELFLSFLHPDDREGVRKVADHAWRTREPYDCQMRVVRRDGTVRNVYVRGIVESDENGGPARVFGTLQDLTEQKHVEEALRESEERVRLLLDSTAEAIYGLDVEGNCTFCNPACLRLLGYRDPGDLLGKSMHELIHHTQRDGEPYPRQACRIMLALMRDEEVHTDDEVLWRADRTSFPAEYWSHPVRREGQPVGAVVTFLDITERRRLEQEILEISERERQRIGQDLHDDLCQQLTGIAFTGRLLQQRLAAGSVPEASVAERIVQAVQQATDRARDLAKGLHPVRLEADGLAAALTDLAITLESVFRISCRFRCRTGRQSVRIANPAVAIQLYRIAQESATNAVKHSKAKEIRINIGVVKGRMKLAIADNGVGIAEVPHGAGMGLPVMYLRARTIGAVLTISKRRRGGTLVTCSLKGAPSSSGTERDAAKQAPRRPLDPFDRLVKRGLFLPKGPLPAHRRQPSS